MRDMCNVGLAWLPDIKHNVEHGLHAWTLDLDWMQIK